MAGISIFAKRAYLSAKSSQGYLKRVSSIIRADQVADKIGAKLNPKNGYKNGVCIYVKPEPDPIRGYVFEGKSPYLDIIDGWGYIPILMEHPEVTAIVCSERDYISLASERITNKIVLIPQHHCNFDREKRTRREITTVGVIGNHKAFPLLPADLKVHLAERGMELLEFSEFFTRQDIIDFYKKIDIQIVWRPYRKKLANPLKIVNAASFGIPTIALDEIYFKEMGNCYMGVHNFDHFLVELDRVRTSANIYAAYSKLALEKAEKYHIEEIAKLYKDLK